MNETQPTARQIEAMLSAARAKAEELGAKVVIAIVDAGGGLIGYLRMPGAFLVSNDLATDKAWTAASFAASTRAVGALLDGEDATVHEGLLKRPRMTIVPGGVPLMVDGRCVGGVGVSGGSAVEDEAIAGVGVEKTTSQLH